jgi:hypothetical protein
VAKGYNAAGDLRTTADGTDLNDIWSEHAQTLAIANEARTALASLFTFDTTDASELVPQGFGGSDFEEASEYGVPKSLRNTVDTVKLGYPMKWYDLAARYTYAFLRDASAAQVASVHASALEADNRLVFGRVMERVFNPAITVNEDGTPVYGFWNGTDGTPPASPEGETFAANHTHYLTSGGATVVSADVDDLVGTVEHHGFGLRQNGDRVIVLANPLEADVISGFRVANGDTFDAIPTTDAPAFITDQTIQGDRPPGTFNGLTVACAYGDAWIVRDRKIPAGYMVALATAGPNSERNPLAFRQHVRPEQQGLREIPGHPDYPLIDAYYARGFGVGVRQRGAGAVMQVTANATYTPPALYVAA